MSRTLKPDRDPGSGIRGPEPGAPGSESPELPAGRDERVLAEVDRELRTLLSAVPSPGFEARVLGRIEEDAPSRGLSYAWLAAAASVALVAGLLFALPRVRPVAVVNRPAAVEPRASTSPSTAGNPPVASAATANAGIGSPSPAAVRHAPRAARRAGPDVIVPPNQMEAVRRLVRVINEGRIEAPPEPPQGPVPPPAELAVPELVIKPIPIPTIGPESEAAAPGNQRSY